MKKLFFVALICFIAMSCNRFESVETPIAKTQNLVTYTAPKTQLVGIKTAGAENNLTEPLYAQVVAKNGFLVVQVGFSSETAPVQWDLLNMNGKSVTGGKTYDKIKYGENYFIFEKGKDKYCSNDGLKTIVGPYQNFFVHQDRMFFKSNGKWGNTVLEPNWEKILVLEQADGKDFRYFVKVPEKEQWKVYNSKGKFIKNSSSSKIRQIEKNRKYADKMWGSETIYGRTVPNIKAY